jgi:exosortase C (VPDSG-CTERM-specific)
MAENAKDSTGSATRRHWYLGGFVAASILVSWKTLSTLAAFSLQQESSSHILLIPVVSIYLLYTERKRIFKSLRSGAVPGVSLILAGAIVLLLFIVQTFFLGQVSDLPAATFFLVMTWIGLFTLFYGTNALRAAAFPLAFLLLMIPLPENVLARTIYFLQSGSTDIAYFLFRAVGVPVLRQGFFLTVPGVTIEVATECSGIRSSVALFITCLIAAHLFLRTPWKQLLFVLLAVPLALIKNGIRIVTLTLLSIYVDPGFLTGSLHHKGGFVFFLLALAILFPVLLLLQKSERNTKPSVVLPQNTESRVAGEL